MLYGGIFDLDNKINQIELLSKQQEDPATWTDGPELEGSPMDTPRPGDPVFGHRSLLPSWSLSIDCLR